MHILDIFVDVIITLFRNASTKFPLNSIFVKEIYLTIWCLLCSKPLPEPTPTITRHVMWYYYASWADMLTSWRGNTVHIIDLSEENPRCQLPGVSAPKRASDAVFMFSVFFDSTCCWPNSPVTSDLRRHEAHVCRREVSSFLTYYITRSHISSDGTYDRSIPPYSWGVQVSL